MRRKPRRSSAASGLDRIEGTIAGGFADWIGAGLPMAELAMISAGDLRAAMDGDGADPIRIVDVRSTREFRGGHIDGSINIPVGEIPARAHELDGDGVVATICEGGYRSALAASLLAHEGLPRLVNVAGGMAAYRALETS